MCPHSFYAKVSDLHAELYKAPAIAMANPLVAFTLIKRLHSEWLNVVYSDEGQENTQGWLSLLSPDTSVGDKRTLTPLCCHHLPNPIPPPHKFTYCPTVRPALRSGYEEEEAALPKLEDLQGAAKGLMRLQDVYALQVGSMVKGRFQRVTDGKPTDVCLPTVSVPLSGDDCFLVGKVHMLKLLFNKKY